MELHISPSSPYVRKVRVSVRELGLEDQVEEVITVPWDEDAGTIVRGATVQSMCFDAPAWEVGGRDLGNGSFRIVVTGGEHVVTAEAPGYARGVLQLLDAAQQTSDVRVPLQRAGTLIVQVADSVELRGLELTVDGARYRRERKIGSRTTRVEGLPPGPCTVIVSWHGLEKWRTPDFARIRSGEETTVRYAGPR